MRNAAFWTIAALVLVSCSPDPESPAPSNTCTKELFSNYNPTVLSQCVEACKKCDHGTTATCSTSCNLKGAR
jgi:hypothetical protein